MYKLLKVEDTVRVPPKRFSDDLRESIIAELDSTLVGRIDKSLGLVLAVTDVEQTGEGKIIMGDGAVYFNATFEMLVYQPVINEVVEGTVTEITEFGAFVNFGPMDGLIHVSQVTEDFMSYDNKNAVLLGKETKRTLKAQDSVRARVITVSLKTKFSDSKIGLTMRQPYLGKTEWLEEEKRLAQDKKEGKVKDEKKPEKGRKDAKPKAKPARK